MEVKIDLTKVKQIGARAEERVRKALTEEQQKKFQESADRVIATIQDQMEDAAEKNKDKVGILRLYPSDYVRPIENQDQGFCDPDWLVQDK